VQIIIVGHIEHAHYLAAVLAGHVHTAELISVDDPTPTNPMTVLELAAREVERSFRDLEMATIELAEVLDIDPDPVEHYPGPVLATRPRIIDNADQSGANTTKALAEYYRPIVDSTERTASRISGGPCFFCHFPVRALFAHTAAQLFQKPPF
jgi:hypothetical protein